MKKIVMSVMSGMLGLGLFVNSLYANTINSETFENMSLFKQIGAKVDNFGEIGQTGIYLVQGMDGKNQPFKVAVDKKGEYVFIIQTVIDTKSKQEFKLPVNLDLLKGKEAFSYGNGKEVLYVFTDPECPYCKQFEKEWPKLKDKYTFKVFLFNLSFHKNANAMSYYIINGGSEETRGDRLIEIANGNETNWKKYNKDLEENILKEMNTTLVGKSLDELKQITAEVEKRKNAKLKEAKEILKTSTELGNKSGVQGTPTTFDSKGNSIQNWKTLLK